MKNIFIELTNSDNEKFTLNILQIVLIEPNKKGTTLQCTIGDMILQRKAIESYDQVKAIIASMN